MRVTTERLTLRPFRLDDVDAYARLRAQPALVRFLPGGVAQAAEARASAERIVPAFAAQWDARGYGPWAVVETSSQRFVGHLGLRYLPELNETEVLYMLDEAVWGRGYATEGCVVACELAFRTIGLARVIAMAMPENVASVRVMQKLGMRYQADVDWAGLRLVRYELDRDDWRRDHPDQG